MRKYVFLLFVVGTIITSCEKYNDAPLWEKIQEHEKRIASLEQLCSQMNSNISSLKTIVDALENNDYVKSVTPIIQYGKEIGYAICFSKGTIATIYHGKDGDGGEFGSIPVIGAKKDSDGVYYWTVNGEWLKDSSGGKIPATGPKGDKGDAGKDGATPQLKIEMDYWYVSTDGGKSWTKLSKAIGDGGSNGESLFSSVVVKDGSVIFTLSNGTTFTLPLSDNYPISFTSEDAHIIEKSGNELIVNVKTDFNEIARITANIEEMPDDVYTKAVGGWKAKINISEAEKKAIITITSDQQISKVILTVTLVMKNGETYTISKVLQLTEDNPNPSDPIVFGQTANCYIVTTKGEFRFQADVIGNGQVGILPYECFHTNSAKINPKSIELLWADEGVVIENLRLSNGTAIFNNYGANGNAVVAVRGDKDEDNDGKKDILWSWHIWITDQPKDVEINGFAFMDRNLGAISTAHDNTEKECGLYYQWGRKDPFQRGGENRDVVEFPNNDKVSSYIKHPTSFFKSNNINDLKYAPLWGNPQGYLGGQGLKSIYDPCPVGYTIIHGTVFRNIQLHHSTIGDGWIGEVLFVSRTILPEYLSIKENGTFVIDNEQSIWVPEANALSGVDNLDSNRVAGDYIIDYYGYHGFWTDTPNYYGGGVSFYVNAGNFINEYGSGVPVRCIKETVYDRSEPSVSTSLSTAHISPSSADVTGRINTNNNSDIISYGFRWGESPQNLDKMVVINATNGESFNDVFSHTISLLKEKTQYFFQAFATNSFGTGFGEVLSFTTKSVPEQVSVNLVQLYRRMSSAGFSTEGSTHQCFGISAYSLAADVMGEDLIMSAQGSGWFWFDCLYEVKSRYASKTWRSYDLWTAYYSWIELANQIIDYVKESGNTKCDQYVGQAYAIRAYSYFMLAQWFARTYKGHENDPCVPIYTSYQSSLDKNKPRESVRSVFNQAVSDIDKAIKLLHNGPKHNGFLRYINELSLDYMDYEFITQQVAYGIKARICQVMEDWEGAKQCAQEAQNGTSIGTQNDLTSGFNSVKAKNVMWGVYFTYESSGVYASLFMHMIESKSIRAYGNYSLKQMNKELYSHLGTNDIRRNWWNTRHSSGGYQQIKFKWSDEPSYLGDYIWMRHEEMVLIEAEAECRLGNEVRARELLVDLIKTRDPEYACDKSGTNLGALTSDYTGSLLEEIIIQRRIELWGEFGRIYDIKRLKQGFVRKREDGWPSAALITDKNTKDPESYEWVMTIPQSAFDENPNMDATRDQNPL